MTKYFRAVVRIVLVPCLAREAYAQRQPTTIPTVVAQAMSFYSAGVFDPPNYFVKTPPPGWPTELVPANARVIGGGSIAAGALFHVLTLVVSMPAGSRPQDVLGTMAARAGYGTRASSDAAAEGGFVATDGTNEHSPLCKGASNLFEFSPVDSVTSPRVFALRYIGGEAAGQNCAAGAHSRSSMSVGGPRFGPRSLPVLVAPRGVAATEGGMSWGNNSGSMTSVLLTSMLPDSILAHYSAQMIKAGWSADGSALANSAVGVQKFRIADGDDTWSAMMLVEAVGKRRDVTIRLAVVNREP